VGRVRRAGAGVGRRSASSTSIAECDMLGLSVVVVRALNGLRRDQDERKQPSSVSFPRRSLHLPPTQLTHPQTHRPHDAHTLPQSAARSPPHEKGYPPLPMLTELPILTISGGDLCSSSILQRSCRV
jgi:hypothetical protein